MKNILKQLEKIFEEDISKKTGWVKIDPTKTLIHRFCPKCGKEMVWVKLWDSWGYAFLVYICPNSGLGECKG